MQPHNNKLFRLPTTFMAALAIAALAGCASQVPLNEKAGDGTGAGGSGGPGGAATTKEIAAARANLDKVKPSIYFDFDRFDIKSEYQNTIAAYSSYMKADGRARLIIEGNADERGTTEYNLALGQKRAEAVSKALGLMGVPANRMEAVSNGEEKPRAKGSNEAAWTENRRADLILK
jgi:peptidoglycan-associated lipoprotein